MGISKRLLKPVDYLRIKNPTKRKYDFYIPLSLALIGTTLLVFLPKPISLLGQFGLMSSITRLLQILTGFYIASLAAVATFSKAGMDDVMPGKPLTLVNLKRGKPQTETLTRRRFLCLMFGYLALLSVFLYFIGVGADLLAENVRHLVSVKWHGFVKWAFVFCYLFWVSNLLVTTFLGLYYMSDKIHRHEPKLTIGDSDG